MSNLFQCLLQVSFRLVQFHFERPKWPVVIALETVVDEIQEFVLRYPRCLVFLRLSSLGSSRFLPIVSRRHNSSEKYSGAYDEIIETA